MRIPRHLWVTLAAWISRIAVALVQVAVIRLITKHLGAEQYAAFALLYGLSGWFALADFGAGFSLQNEISGRRAHSVPYAKLVGRVAGCVLGALVLESALLALLARPLGTSLLRQFKMYSGSDKALLFGVSGSLLLVAGIGQVAYKTWYAEQKGTLSNVLPAVGQLLGLAALFTVFRVSTSVTLLRALTAYLLPSALVAVSSLVYLLIRAQGSNPGTHSVQPLVRRAFGFGAFGVCSALVLQVDLPIISQFLPPDQIATYAIVSRIYAFVFMIFSSALLALWPVCAELLAAGNFGQVRKYMNAYVGIGFLFVGVFSVGTGMYLPLVTHLLAPGLAVHLPSTVIGGFCFLYLIRVWTDTYAMALQSKNSLRPLWISTPLQAIVSTALQFLLVPRLGLLGAVLGLIISFLLTSAWILPFYLRREIAPLPKHKIRMMTPHEAFSVHSHV